MSRDVSKRVSSIRVVFFREKTHKETPGDSEEYPSSYGEANSEGLQRKRNEGGRRMSGETQRIASRLLASIFDTHETDVEKL